jgi:hypothetical protein
MAMIELGPLSQFLEDNEIRDLMKALKKIGVGELPRSDDAGGVEGEALDDDVWADFSDRLDAEDIAADLYLPVEFDGVVEIAGYKVGSSVTLIDILDDIKDDLDVESDADEEEEDDSDDDDDEESEEDDADDDEDYRLREKLLKQVWKVLRAGAKSAVKRQLPLYVKTG